MVRWWLYEQKRISLKKTKQTSLQVLLFIRLQNVLRFSLAEMMRMTISKRLNEPSHYVLTVVTSLWPLQLEFCLSITDTAQLSNSKSVSGHFQICFHYCIWTAPSITAPLSWKLPPCNSSAESNLLTMHALHWNKSGIYSSHTSPQLKRQSVLNYSDKYKSTWKLIAASIHSEQFTENRTRTQEYSPEPKNHRGIATGNKFQD